MEKLIRLLKKNIPDEINKFYIVGGFARDLYMNRTDFNDIDIVWPVDEAKMAKYFKKQFMVKEKTNTYISHLFCENKKIKVEISPLKKDSIKEDLLSRDLTVNSIALCVSKENDEMIWLDPAGGIEDITYEVLRCVKEENLKEDPLRMLRIFRFQSKFNYVIDSYTFDCIIKNNYLINYVPKEMIYAEFMKIFEYKYSETALRNMTNAGLLQKIIPELTHMISFRHKDKHHKYETVFEHSMRVLRNCGELNLDVVYKIAALFHDMEKPAVFDGKHYLFHERESAKSSEIILKRLKFPNKVINQISTIIKNHMIPMNSRKKLFQMRYELGIELFDSEIQFINADKKATHSNWYKTDTYTEFIALKNEVSNSEDFFQNIDKIVNGDRLLEIGLHQSIGIKYILDYLRVFFFKNPKMLSNEKAVELLKNNLKYDFEYKRLVWQKDIHFRKKEYIKQKRIVGLLENEQKLNFKTGLFEYNYLSKGEFEHWFIKNKKECTLFFSQ